MKNCLHTYSQKKVLLGLVFLFCFAQQILAQSNNIGIPFTTNYLNQTYKAGTQNWDIGQHPNGFLFFANNNGLLQFDGTNWTVFPLPNKTIVRSLCVAKDGKIYVGGQGDFGYFEANKTGLLVFHSLLGYVPAAHKNFSDVWDIVAWNDGIYFQASGKIYVFREGEIKLIEADKIHFLEEANNRLFLGNDNGLFELQNDKVKRIIGGEQLKGKLLTAVLSLSEDRLLFSSLGYGLFELKSDTIYPIYTEHLDFWERNKIYCISPLASKQVAIGTTNAGLVILDTQTGRIQQHLTKQNGLHNNNILSAFKDQQQNLWLGLDNGIDYVATSSPFTKIIPDAEQEGTAYAAKIFKNQLFLGTSSGLYRQTWKDYYKPTENNRFQAVEGSKGQVWGLQEIDEQLFLGHHTDSYLIKDTSLMRLSLYQGSWLALPLVQQPDHYIIGTYEGLVLCQKTQNSWKRIRKLEGLDESCRILEQDEAQNIWVSHPYRGIYKVRLSEDFSRIEVKLYGEAQGLPSTNLNHVFKINGEVVFTGETGIYTYSKVSDSFVPHTELTQLIGEGASVLRFFEDSIGNIWYVTTEETALLKVEDKGLSKTFTKVVYPELNKQLVRGFEFIYPYNEQNVFIGAEKGFIHFNPSKVRIERLNLSTNIVNVESLNNDKTLLSGQYQSYQSGVEAAFNHQENAFRFSFAAPDFQSGDKLRYATKLEGYDKNWSAWTSKTEKEFNNLSPGNYRFGVKSKSIDGTESESATFEFIILSPWYASMKALILYTFLVFAFIAGLIWIPQRRFEEEKTLLKSEQERKEAAHQEEVARSEQAIVALKNQQLEIEIAHKNQELAMSTMHLVQRKELIQQLNEKLSIVIKNTQETATEKELKRITRLLEHNAQLDDAWNQFAHHFDQVHVDFLRGLKEEFPSLTANDQKLCAYLKMNLTTKEIAPLMNISIRGVEVARYRLRKKLGVDSSVNLNEFMTQMR